MKNTGNYNKTMICALCGKEIRGTYSKNHCYPRAIHKWLADSLDEDEASELKSLISGQDNIIYTHTGCSSKKEDFEVNVDTLCLPWYKKERVRETRVKIRPYAKQYHEMKARIYESQAHKCLQCGCRLTENNGVMRRINTEKPRTEENACLVCHSCNHANANFVEAKKQLDGDGFQWRIIEEQQRVLFRNLKAYGEQLRRQQKEVELEITEVQRDIEVLSFEDQRGYQAYQRLKELLSRRSHIKSELERVAGFLPETLGRRGLSA